MAMRVPAPLVRTCAYHVCENPPFTACTGCYRVFYCCQIHQSQDRTRHQSECGDYFSKINQLFEEIKAAEQTAAPALPATKVHADGLVDGPAQAPCHFAPYPLEEQLAYRADQSNPATLVRRRVSSGPIMGYPPFDEHYATNPAFAAYINAIVDDPRFSDQALRKTSYSPDVSQIHRLYAALALWVRGTPGVRK